MKKILLTISGLLAMASITQLEARWHANINFGYHRPRHVYRSYRPVYVQEPEGKIGFLTGGGKNKKRRGP